MADESSYMVFTEDGQRHGPLPNHRVLELLERGFISESAEVEHESTGRAPLPLHPHFAGFFIEGDSRNAEFRKKRAVRARRSRKMRGRRRMRVAGRLVIALAAIGGIALAVVYRDVIITAVEPYLDRSSDDASGLSREEAHRGETEEQGGSNDTSLAELTDLFSAYSGSETVSAVEHLELGWRALVAGGLHSNDRIQGHMEQAVRISDGKPWALVGLVVSAMLDSSGQGGEEPVAKLAMGLLVRSGADSEIDLAKSAGTFALGEYEESLQHAQSCLVRSPGHAECVLFSAIAAGRAGRALNAFEDSVTTARNAYPDSMELVVWEQMIAFEKGDVLGAEMVLRGIDRKKSKSPIYFRLSAQIEERLGNWSAAREAHLAEYEMDSNAVESGLKAAILGYQVEGRLKEGQALLALLAKNPKLTASQRAKIALHASHVARISGDFESAITFADEPTESVIQRRYLVLAQAMAYAELGRRKEVDARIVEINQSSFVGRESARYHAWLAKYYLQSERVRLALWALQNAKAADPHWGLLASFGIEIDVRVGNLSSLPKRLEDAVGLDLAQEKMREPWSNIPHLGSSDVGLLGVIESTLKRNIYYADSVDVVSGVWLLSSCEKPRFCDSAETRLLRASKGEKQAVVAQLGLLHIYSDREDWERVAELLDELRPSRSATGAYLAFQGAYLLNTGKLQGALRSYRQVAQLLPKSSLGPRGLVRVYQRLGDRQGMQAALAAVRKLDPNDSVTAAVSLKEGVAR